MYASRGSEPRITLCYNLIVKVIVLVIAIVIKYKYHDKLETVKCWRVTSALNPFSSYLYFREI